MLVLMYEAWQWEKNKIQFSFGNLFSDLQVSFQKWMLTNGVKYQFLLPALVAEYL